MESDVLQSQKDQCVEIVATGLFDEYWYKNNFKWVAEQGIDCVEHYLESGERNNRTPNEHFDPNWYRRKYLAGFGETCCLLHYYRYGRYEGFAPSPNFDPCIYISKYAGEGVKMEDALLHWVSSGKPSVSCAREQFLLESSVDACGLFLPVWYAEYYLDVSGSGMSPLEHYCSVGVFDNRLPNPYFNPVWYQAVNPHVEKTKTNPLLHYAEHGWRNGKTPSLRFNSKRHEQVCAKLGDRKVEPLNWFLLNVDSSNGKVNSVRRSKNNRVDLSVVSLYRDYFSEPGFGLIAYYAGQKRLTAEVRRDFSDRLTRLLEGEKNLWLRDVEILETVAMLYHPVSKDTVDSLLLLDEFLEFLEGIGHGEILATTLFDPSYYRSVNGSIGTDAECLMSWLQSKEKMVPNAFFDSEQYAKDVSLKSNCPIELFRHWLYTGMFENRKFNVIFDLSHISSQLDSPDDSNVFADYIISQGISFNPRFDSLVLGKEKDTSVEIFKEYSLKNNKAGLISRLSEGALKAQIMAAVDIDSKVFEKGFDIPITLPPFNSLLAPVVKKVRRDIPKNNYDTVLMIPHCRLSGATKIAGRFADALLRIGKESSILLLITDLDINQRPDWFPECIDTFSLPSIYGGLDSYYKEDALLDLLVGVRAKRIYNFNSALGWSVYEKYGTRLSTISNLYAYLYCYDLNVNDIKVGYPSKYFVSTFDSLKKVFFDSDYLREELIEKNLITDGRDLERLVTLYTPVDDVTAVGLSERLGDNDCRQVFWAGRLDRQKNFDLVIRIATLLPDVVFHCWGESVIGDYLLSAIPQNIRMNPSYDQFEDLPFENCDAWLYTALWDGIPNQLLEVGSKGIPIVSTGVWGVNDLLDNSNSRLILDVNNEHEYVSELQKLFDDKHENEKLSKALICKIKERHCFDLYCSSISNSIYESA